MFDGFENRMIAANGIDIRTAVGGSGPPLLLLHGYPQTHAMWHRVAVRLAQDFTVVCTDLRGYGDSAKPPGGDGHGAYAKREMARDQVEVMDELGFERFRVAGHDRGGRVTHRMVLDNPERIEQAAVLDIVPTHTVFKTTDQALATAYFHWFFLIQRYDLPERMIGADPDYWLDRLFARWGEGPQNMEAEAIAEYRRCFSDPATIHASCEDYRAAAGIDLEHDEADSAKRLDCPLLVLWGLNGAMERLYDVMGEWRKKAVDVSGQALPCGHYLPEELPDETYEALHGFFTK